MKSYRVSVKVKTYVVLSKINSFGLKFEWNMPLLVTSLQNNIFKSSNHIAQGKQTALLEKKEDRRGKGVSYMQKY